MSCEFVAKIGTGDCELAKKCNKSENDFPNILANEIVSEMIDNALDIAGTNDNKENFTKIVDGILDNLSEKFHEMVLTDDRNQSVESCSLPCKGLGDQLKTKEKLQKEKTPQRHPPVEKKNRLTDLVKNSKHILEKFMINDKEKAALATKPEKVVRVVELNNGDCHIMSSIADQEHQKASTPFDDDQPSFDEQDDQMEEVDINKDGGDDFNEFNAAKSKTLPPMASTSSEKTLSLSAKWRTLKISSSEFRKKKWNLGSKLVSYIKKTHGKSCTTLEKDKNDFEDNAN